MLAGNRIMAAHYYVDEKNDILVGVASGLVQVDELISEANRVFTETNGAAFTKNHLFVLAAGALSSMIDEDAMTRLRGFIESWAAKFPGRYVRTAILVEDTSYKEHAFERWEEIVEDAANYRVETRIMTDRDKAVAWLTEKAET